MEEIKNEPKVSREELFKTEPENFKHVSELSLCITKDDGSGQRMILVGTQSAFEMGGLLFMLLRHCMRMLDAIEIQKLKDKQLIQEVNKKGFRNFLRKS